MVDLTGALSYEGQALVLIQELFQLDLILVEEKKEMKGKLNTSLKVRAFQSFSHNEQKKFLTEHSIGLVFRNG